MQLEFQICRSQCTWRSKFRLQLLGMRSKNAIGFLCRRKNGSPYITNYNVNVAHEKRKHHIKGASKQHFDKLLENASAHSVYVRSQPIDEKRRSDPINFCHKMECALLNTETAPWVIKSLIQMKSKSHAAVIADISIFPFSVTYQLPM